ncbi:ion channel [Sorangium sp. So ce1078]|uniref:ion channel n=1 Tax=Sorangium sp. So ce1078 TaxID=3133329 RepID=UPI003F63C87A
MGDPSALAARKIAQHAAAAAPSLGRDERLRGAVALLALGLAAGGAGELSYDQLKQRCRDAMARDPFDSLAVMLLGCSYLFYQAEHGENPRCASFLDALLFVSTCLSGGYADRFAQTAAGKAIASFVMTMGPSLAASRLSAPPGAEDQGQAIVERLDGILEALRAPR